MFAISGDYSVTDTPVAEELNFNTSYQDLQDPEVYLVFGANDLTNGGSLSLLTTTPGFQLNTNFIAQFTQTTDVLPATLPPLFNTTSCVYQQLF